MNTLPVVTSWDDIQPGIESVLGAELVGWRACSALQGRTIVPFTWNPAARADCSLPLLEQQHLIRHTGEKVHPECSCGLNIVRTRSQALSYLRHTRDIGRLDYLRNSYSGLYYGEALCKVSAWPGVHVTGPVNRPEMNLVDPSWCARTSALCLEEMHLPYGMLSEDVKGFGTAYPSVTVKQMSMPLAELLSSDDAQLPCGPVPGSPLPRFGNHGAAHVAIQSDGMVLLARRSNLVSTEPRKWGLPGGAREVDESDMACAIRETTEETGIKLTDYSRYGALRHQEGDWEHVTFVVEHYGSTVITGAPCPDTAESRWVTRSQVESLIAGGNATADLAREWPQIKSLFDESTK